MCLDYTKFNLTISILDPNMIPNIQYWFRNHPKFFPLFGFDIIFGVFNRTSYN